MKITELEAVLAARIPKALSCPWDNDGRMVLPDPDRDVERVLVALDATPDVIGAALQMQADLILTHHPLIFSPLKCLDDGDLIRLVRGGVAVYSYHTRLDALQGGVNDALATRIGVRDCVPFGEDGMGRVGVLDATMTTGELAAHLKKTLGTPSVTVLDAGRPIRRVALLGGAGKDLIGDAIAAGADAFVTGEAGYNAILDHMGSGMSILCAGHDHTELPVLSVLAEWVRAAIPHARITVWDKTPLERL